MSESKEEEEEDISQPTPKIIEAPKTSTALKMLSELILTSEEFNKQNIIYIKFKITNKHDENLNESSFAHYLGVSKPILITFKNKNSYNIFWKTAEGNKFCFLQVCDLFGDVESEFCERFLISEISENRKGIFSRSRQRKNLNIQDIGNNKGQNLIILAAINNREDVVAELLKHDFDVDYEDLNGHNAIEKAWINLMDASKLEIKNKFYKIILRLLKNNSKYPRKIKVKTELDERSYEFRYEDCSESIKNFIDYSEKLHNLVTESDLEELKSELEKEPQLVYFYDKSNKSLMSHAIESKELEIWKLLISLKLSTGQHEIQNLGAFYKNYKLSKKKLMRAEHQKWAQELPSSHVHFLLTCSRIGNNDRRCDERWTLVEEAFRIMDTDKSCSRILKIAAKWKRLTIYFDFKHDTAYYLDPASSLGTKGVIYGAHTIYIGAKDLFNESMKHKVISVIIHELCHLAVFLTYINSYNPYPKGELDAQIRFINEVVPECEENGHHEEIVGGVALYYPEEFYDSEYIVRIVQMLMHYYVQDPSIECENSRILKDRRDKFGKLFKYFEEIVEKDFDDFLGIVDTLLNEYEDINYGQLTVPMKARILNSEINFQGEETTFLEVIGNNEEILKQMTSRQIRDMLISGECPEIGSKHTTSTKLSNIERQFTIPDSYINKTMSEVQNEVKNSKVFILSDSAGAGKTTTFEELTDKLKENNKNFWVCFIKLRDHRLIFDSYDRCKELTFDDILQLMVNIQSFEDTLAIEIFKFLFKDDKVIMLLDGIDEVSPNYNEFIVKFLEVLKKETKNLLWISSRPQCAKILEENLDIKAHKLEPYTMEEREIFVDEIYDNFYSSSKDKPSSESKITAIHNLKVFFETLEKNKYNDSLENEVNNPLMIKMTTELHIQGQINLNPDSANLFDIFDKVTAKLRREVGQKVDSDDNNAFSTFNLGHVHQVLVLKTLFEYNDIKELTIINEWKDKRTYWSVDRIQRFGFVTLDSRFDKNPRRKYIDIVHRTYADFFAAQYIISVIFDTSCKNLKNNDDFKIIFELINKIDITGDSSIANFLLSFMQSNKSKKMNGSENVDWLCELFRGSIDFQSHHKTNKTYDQFELSKMELILVILSNNQKIAELVWKLHESQNFLEYTLFYTNVGIRDICEILHISFGTNWQEKFKKKIGNFEFEFLNEIVSPSIKRELKFIEFVENNYDISQKCIIYGDHHIFSTLYNMSDPIRKKFLMSIFMRFVEVSTEQEEKDFLQMMEKFIWNRDELKYFLKEQCDILLINCNKKDENILEKFKHEVIESIIQGSPHCSYNEILKRLKVTKNIWNDSEKYKNLWRKRFLKLKIDILSFFDYPSDEYDEYKELLIEVFKSNLDELLNIFEYFNSFQLILNKDKFNRFEKFLSEFENSEIKISFLRKVLRFDDDGNLFIKPIKTNKECFIRVVDLLFFDKENYGKLRNYLFSLIRLSETVISKIISNMTDEIFPEFMKFLYKLFEGNRSILVNCVNATQIFKPIENSEQFNFLVKFYKDIFEQNHQNTVQCIRRSFNAYFSISNIYSSISFGKARKDRIVEILTIYGHYFKDSYNNIFDYSIERIQFLEIIAELSNESCDNFISICAKIFSKFKPHPNEYCLRCYGEPSLKFFNDKEKIQKLEKFLNTIYNGNDELKKSVNRNLVYDNFDYLLCNATQDKRMLKILIKFINENNCSIEELRKIFVAGKMTLKIFYYTPAVNYKSIMNYIKKIFISDIEQIVNSIGIAPLYFGIQFHDMKKDEKFHDFEKYLLKIVGNDNQHLVDKCFIKIFKYVYGHTEINDEKEEEELNMSCDCYQEDSLKKDEIINECYESFFCINHEPLLWIFYYEDFKEIKILTNITKHFDNHWEWAQNLFSDNFPFDSIQRMSSDTIDAFINFLKLVFKSDKLKLSEEIQKKYLNDEILNNENENCKKFVQAFIEIEK